MAQERSIMRGEPNQQPVPGTSLATKLYHSPGTETWKPHEVSSAVNKFQYYYIHQEAGVQRVKQDAQCRTASKQQSQDWNTMAIRLKLKILSIPSHRGPKFTRVPSSDPADSSCIGAEAGSKTGVGQRAVLELLPGCQARQLFRGKGNYSSRLRAANATQKGDCSSTKGVLCPAAVSHCPQLHPYPTQTTRTLSC